MLLAFHIWAAVSLFISCGICSRSLSPDPLVRQTQLELCLTEHMASSDSPSQHKFYMSSVFMQQKTTGRRGPGFKCIFLLTHVSVSQLRHVLTGSTFMMSLFLARCFFIRSDLPTSLSLCIISTQANRLWDPSLLCAEPYGPRGSQ